MAEVFNPKAKSNKALLWIVIIVVVILVGLAGYFYGKQTGSKQTTVVNMPVKTEASLETWDYGNVPPEIFLKDFPFEAGTRLVESTKTIYKDSGDTQVHLVYYSKKTIGDNLTNFRNYLKNNGWTIITDTAAGQVYTLYAKKDKSALSILMSFDQTGAGLKIDVNYLIYR